ncbi:MAG: FeoA family protein [Phycisphaerae bacterium]|nr:FeoA family protein [Phycisphaerae bacterium]
MPALSSPDPASTAGGPASLRIPLSQLKRGDRAIIDFGDLDSHDTRLLEAMGLTDRSEVRVCRAGTPCIVQIEATRLGISAGMAAAILATPCSCFPDPAHACGNDAPPDPDAPTS